MRTSLVLGVFSAVVLGGCTSETPNDLVRIKDIHGLALDPSVQTRLYVATHHGLFVAENDTNWAAVTKEPFDMMGFTMHPLDGRIMYASGHPSGFGKGWAVGVVKSTDAGRTWTTISLKNEVDFHAMAMQPGESASQDTIYGFHAGTLLVSIDGGRTWQTRSPPAPVAALAVASNGDVLAATDSGLHRGGRGAAGEWRSVSADPAVAVATRGDTMVVYFTSGGLRESRDDGATWASLNWMVPSGDYPWGIALGPDSVYVGTARGTIHKTPDAGATWRQIK